MSSDLSDSQIALLCDIEDHDVSKAPADKRRDLEQLISWGYVEPGHGDRAAAFRLTAKGVDFLGERGAGLNEG
jgi:hypothetical protein